MTEQPKRPMQRVRITVELLRPEPSGRDTRVAIYSADQGRIAGDIWLNGMTQVFSTTLDAAEVFVGIGDQAGGIRSAAEMARLAKGER